MVHVVQSGQISGGEVPDPAFLANASVLSSGASETQPDTVHSAEQFLKEAMNVLLGRRQGPTTHSEFLKFYPTTSFDFAAGHEQEKVAKYSQSACRTLAGFQQFASTMRRELEARDASIIGRLSESQLSADTYESLTHSANIVRRVSQMEAFLIDFLTYESPLASLRMYANVSCHDSMHAPPNAALIAECARSYERLLVSMTEPTNAAAKSLQQGLTEQYYHINLAQRGVAALDTLAITKAHIAISSAVALLEAQLFAIDTPHFLVEHALRGGSY